MVKGGYSLYAGDDTHVAECCGSLCTPAIDEANARRLAACWNACEGLTTENLELCGTLDYADVKRNVAQTAYVNDLQTQRDQLLEALKNIVDVGLSTSRIAAARAAIAKTTGDKA
jgi:hypothetical protein